MPSYSNSEKKLLDKLGKRINFLRTQKGYSQEALAERAGLHRTYIGSAERGERNVSIINLEKLAKALDTSLNELVI